MKNKTEIKKHPVLADYGADTEGNAYSFKHGKTRKLKPGDRRGYNGLTICLQGKRINIYVHKLVWECFNGTVNFSSKSGEGMTIDHIDGNKTNNSIANLQILSSRENVQKNYPDKSSKYTGVCFDKNSNKFMSEIGIGNRKTKFLGRGPELICAIKFDDHYESLHGIRPNQTKYPEDFPAGMMKAMNSRFAELVPIYLNARQNQPYIS